MISILIIDDCDGGEDVPPGVISAADLIVSPRPEGFFIHRYRLSTSGITMTREELLATIASYLQSTPDREHTTDAGRG